MGEEVFSGAESLETIDCEAASQPDKWSKNWLKGAEHAKVIWTEAQDFSDIIYNEKRIETDALSFFFVLMDSYQCFQSFAKTG